MARLIRVLEGLAILAGIFEVVDGSYDRAQQRRMQRERDEKDRRIERLEERISELEEQIASKE